MTIISSPAIHQSHTGRPRAANTASAPNSIGFLRLALACTVLYSHALLLGGFTATVPDALWEWSRHTLIAGSAAVQGFFVLSGALIARSWMRTPSPLRFLWHRVLRIVPAFWICLAVTALIFTPLAAWHAHRLHGLPSEAPAVFGYIWRNLVQPRGQIAIGEYPRDCPWPGDWNGSLWTLFYEGACYFLVAIIGILGLLRRWRAIGIGLLVTFLALFTIHYVDPDLFRVPTISRLFDTPGKELTMYFIAGILWALKGNDNFGTNIGWWLGLVSTIALIATWHAGIGIATGVLLMPPMLFWLADALPLRRFEALVKGDYSYGFYIYSYPIEQLFAQLGLQRYGPLMFLIASFAATLVCAIASWHLIEKVALQFKSWQPKLRPGL
jgi:peptidoglycan/LPS O-acetylase OafA/YrhL